MSAVNTGGPEPAVLFNFLSKLGLEKYYPNKLTLQSLLEINKKSIYEEAVLSVKDIPWSFLRKLFQINAECRSCMQLSNCLGENNDLLDLDINPGEDATEDNEVNPLDLIVALFLCADSFLQQEMALKMSMCQFSVPLVLPIGKNSQCTLMLWALRDIVKEWRPHNLFKSRGFVEDNIVQAKMPFFSFVRLKNCSFSKSRILNQVLSHGQQNHNMFIDREMEGGTLDREIANGLVEVCWYLPSGTEKLNIFPKPVAFANLRGDISASLAQFTFLYQVSTATFVFLDKVEENEHKILMPLQDVKSKLFLVVNQKVRNSQEMMSVKETKKELDLPSTSVKIKESKVNVAEFSKKLCETIKTCQRDEKNPMSIVSMHDKAVELGLSVDESKTHKQKKLAEEIIDDTAKTISQFKKQQLPLQGEDWKTLSHLEKEECRMKEVGDSSLEEYKSQLQAKKQQIRESQSKQKLSREMEKFIETLCTSDKEKRDSFLKWVKFKLNTYSREQLTSLRQKFKEECKKKDGKLTAKLDQELLESSLGIEHYMREVALIYEASLQSQDSAKKMSHLPGVAAEMLLDGHALELLDGDASNIPERWVTDVLMELHKKVGERSRLLVLTVLGVQSTGKSTLLNTMFGVQFPVSSGRCTRGAFMIFLRVGLDIRSDLNFDFILLIDTEGLKSPDMAQLEDSNEHDNQLATFIIGLSDITIINISMENPTEIKDVLQIATHAFLRMKQIGKKPVCHFMHQNVGGVSAYEKTMTERKHLLDQLNEMTNIAADMEKQPSIKAFTDVLDYDIDKNNWNIPGFWLGTPPMAPVNRGYSEAVADFKKNLLETMKRDSDHNVSQIPEFIEWMQSLWKAVKYENFIFSFRNTLVAHAYDNLNKEFSQWEWEFRKEILSWQTAAELEIFNADSESDVETWNRLVGSKKSEVSSKIEDQQRRMTDKLYSYYKRKDRHVNLIQKYKSDFINSIKSLADEIKHSTYSRLDCQLEYKTGLKKVKDIHRKSRSMIEERVMKLMNDCKQSTLTDTKLTQEFEKMWTQATENIPHLRKQDITGSIFIQLRKNLTNYNLSERLHNADELKEMGQDQFKTTREHVDTFMKRVQYLWSGDLQRSADNVTEISKHFILDITKMNCDYQESFSRDLLAKIDEALQQSREQFRTNSQFEIDMKLHICGIASREFLKMHQKFTADNDPLIQLEKYKSQYLKDFLDFFKEVDHCQRKANDFVRNGIKPAVEDYIHRSLGIDIVDEILTGFHSSECSSRLFIQYNIQKELLQKDFESFMKYIREYEIYVKDWIFQYNLQKLSQDKTLCKLKNKNLQVVVEKITKAIEQALNGENGVQLPDNKQSISKLIYNMRKYLIKDVSISEEAEKTTLFQIKSTCHSFAKSLIKSLSELKEELQREFLNPEDITATLNTLPIQPQDELFKQIIGCGEQCPFCKVPCEAGGKQHKQHHAAIHRPQGLGSYKYIHSQKLVETLCTTDMNSKRGFKNADTKQKLRPYRKYAKYYPEWRIPPDSTLEASDYWKYVLVKYNDKFAEEFNANPADVPDAWRSITEAQALKGLKEAFSIK